MKKRPWKRLLRDNLSATLLLGWLLIALVIFGVGFFVWRGFF